MTRQRIFHIWVLVLASACIPSSAPAQTLPEITEPDNTYLRYYKDHHFDEQRPSQPRGDSIFTVLGRWAWGYCLAVDTKDNFAFIGNGPTFQTLDLANPASPVIVGEYIVTDRINDIVIRGNLAYLAMAQGLVVMDIADPTHPQQLGELYLSGIPQQVVVEDSMAYVLSYFTGQMHVVDVSNPAQPVRRSGFGSGEFAYCIAVRSRYVYLGIPNVPAGVLRIVNATNPDALSYRDTTMGFIGRTAATVDTLLLIGATPRVGPIRTLKIFSVADPAYPRQVGEVVIPGSSSNTGGICVVGTKAYLAVLDTGVIEVDISDPTQPLLQRVLNRKPLFAAAGIKSVSGVGLARLGNYLFVAYYTGLLTINKTQPDSLREACFFPTGGTALDVAVHNDLLYIASELAGLWIVNVSDISHPVTVSNIQNGGSISGVIISDTLVYVMNTPSVASDSTRGLWIIGASDLTRPGFLSHYLGISQGVPSYIRANPHAMFGKLILAGQTTGSVNDSTFEVIDVANPRSPRRLGILRGSYAVRSIVSKDSIAYLATSDSGIIVVDLHDPESPERRGRILERSVGLAINDSLLFSVAGPDSFHVLTVFDPLLPAVIGRATISTLNAFEQRLSVAGEYVYLTKRYIGVIDVHEPSHPFERGTAPFFSGATAVAALSSSVFATDVLGLWILRNCLITEIRDREGTLERIHFDLFQNFPNPYNPATSIRFYIPKGDRVRLEIFDLLGRVVATPLNSYIQEGAHSVSFDGSPLSAGVYFYRLTSSQGSLTRRMLLIK
jgi:hypothetical protein